MSNDSLFLMLNKTKGCALLFSGRNVAASPSCDFLHSCPDVLLSPKGRTRQDGWEGGNDRLITSATVYQGEVRSCWEVKG